VSWIVKLLTHCKILPLPEWFTSRVFQDDRIQRKRWKQKVTWITAVTQRRAMEKMNKRPGQNTPAGSYNSNMKHALLSYTSALHNQTSRYDKKIPKDNDRAVKGICWRPQMAA